MKPNKVLSVSRYEYAMLSLAERRAELPSRVLYDVGAGDERMRQLSKFDLDWYGFDLEPQFNAIRWDLSDPLNIDVPKAGAVIMLDVIEHCSNPGRALRNVADVMDDGAVLIATMPNPKWSRSRLEFATSGYLTCFSEHDLVSNHHVFTPWPHILLKLLNDADLTVKEYVTLDGRTQVFNRYPSPTYPLRVASAALMRAIEWYDSSACGMSYGIVAQRTARG